MGTRKKMHGGDLLTFKAATRCDYKKATRKITGFDNYGRPLVRYAGWADFIVQPKEIISVARPWRLARPTMPAPLASLWMAYRYAWRASLVRRTCHGSRSGNVTARLTISCITTERRKRSAWQSRRARISLRMRRFWKLPKVGRRL